MADNIGNFESGQAWTPAVTGSASQSNGLYGNTTSNKDSAVYGEHLGDGIGVFGRGGKNAGQGVFGQTNTSTSAIHGENTSTGAGIVGVSASGFGIVGSSGTSFAMRAEGDVSQARDKGGWVKAMVELSAGPYTKIVRSYVSQPGTPAPTLYRLDIGLYSIDFHFDVSDRYAVVTPLALPYLKAGDSTFPENPFAPYWYPPESGSPNQTNFIVANIVFDGLMAPPDANLGDPALRVPNKTMITVMTFQPVFQGAGGNNFVQGFQLKDTGLSLVVF